MREILFRGKRDPKYGEGWCFGVPYIDHDGDCIIATDSSKRVVIPETVGQYIGLTDKNDKNIFDGDICKNGERTYLICWIDNQYTWGCFNLKTCRKTPIYQVISREGNNFEIIGNRHDTPEMLRIADFNKAEDTNQSVLQPATPENFELMNG